MTPRVRRLQAAHGLGPLQATILVALAEEDGPLLAETLAELTGEEHGDTGKIRVSVRRLRQRFGEGVILSLPGGGYVLGRVGVHLAGDCNGDA